MNEPIKNHEFIFHTFKTWKSLHFQLMKKTLLFLLHCPALKCLLNKHLMSKWMVLTVARRLQQRWDNAVHCEEDRRKQIDPSPRRSGSTISERTCPLLSVISNFCRRNFLFMNFCWTGETLSENTTHVSFLRKLLEKTMSANKGWVKLKDSIIKGQSQWWW